MRKDQNQETFDQEASFDDVTYQDAMRVDPLTTMDEIKSELRELETKRQQREAELLEKSTEETEDDNQEAKPTTTKNPLVTDGSEDTAK